MDADLSTLLLHGLGSREDPWINFCLIGFLLKWELDEYEPLWWNVEKLYQRGQMLKQVRKARKWRRLANTEK